MPMQVPSLGYYQPIILFATQNATDNPVNVVLQRFGRHALVLTPTLISRRTIDKWLGYDRAMCHLTQEIDHSQLTFNKPSSVDALECVCVKVYLQGRILALHVHQLLVYGPLPLHHRIQPFPSPSGIGLAACGWSIYRPRNSWSACLVRDVR
jgi:hypothetical protein